MSDYYYFFIVIGERVFTHKYSLGVKEFRTSAYMSED